VEKLEGHLGDNAIWWRGAETFQQKSIKVEMSAVTHSHNHIIVQEVCTFCTVYVHKGRISLYLALILNIVSLES